MKFRPEVKELYSYISNNELEKLEIAISKDRSLLDLDTPFGSLLHIAASEGNCRIVSLLVAQGIDVNKRSGMAQGTALNEAASKSAEVVELLLKAGAEMDTDEPERNPLFSAIYGCNFSVVNLLVRNGIDYRVKYTGESMMEMDAAAFAHERGELEIRNYLLSLPTK